MEMLWLSIELQLRRRRVGTLLRVIYSLLYYGLRMSVRRGNAGT